MLLSRVQTESQNVAFKGTNRKSKCCYQGYELEVKMLLSRLQTDRQNVAIRVRIGSQNVGFKGTTRKSK